jgi:hypothetical protein
MLRAPWQGGHQHERRCLEDAGADPSQNFPTVESFSYHSTHNLRGVAPWHRMFDVGV